jgi:hypothetical protein
MAILEGWRDLNRKNGELHECSNINLNNLLLTFSTNLTRVGKYSPHASFRLCSACSSQIAARDRAPSPSAHSPHVRQKTAVPVQLSIPVFRALSSPRQIAARDRTGNADPKFHLALE